MYIRIWLRCVSHPPKEGRCIPLLKRVDNDDDDDGAFHSGGIHFIHREGGFVLGGGGGAEVVVYGQSDRWEISCRM